MAITSHECTFLGIAEIVPSTATDAERIDDDFDKVLTTARRGFSHDVGTNSQGVKFMNSLEDGGIRTGKRNRPRRGILCLSYDFLFCLEACTIVLTASLPSFIFKPSGINSAISFFNNFSCLLSQVSFMPILFKTPWVYISTNICIAMFSAL